MALVPLHDGAATYTIDWRSTGGRLAVRIVNQATRQAFKFKARQVFSDKDYQVPARSSCLFQLESKSQYIFVGNRIIQFCTMGKDVITDFYSFEETNAIAVADRYAYALAEWEDVVALSLEAGDIIAFKHSAYRDAWGDLLSNRDAMQSIKVKQVTVNEFSPASV